MNQKRILIWYRRDLRLHDHTAGVGNDARGFRYFNIPKQSRDYDRQGEYIRHWLPELTSIKGTQIHEPDKLSSH